MSQNRDDNLSSIRVMVALLLIVAGVLLFVMTR